jgi:hypothetical protein
MLNQIKIFSSQKFVKKKEEWWEEIKKLRFCLERKTNKRNEQKERKQTHLD